MKLMNYDPTVGLFSNGPTLPLKVKRAFFLFTERERTT